MTKVRGMSLEQHDTRADAFTDRVTAALNRVTDTVSKNLGLTVVAQGGHGASVSVSIDDVNQVNTLWLGVVDDNLLPAAVQNWVTSSNEQAERLYEALPDDRVGDIPVFNSQSQAAQVYMANARNRLVNIGDELWGHVREGLTEGMQLGESIPDLAARVRQAADVTTPRAEVIARTEVISATNGGSIAAIRATNLVTRKEWIATFDARTRPSHAEAHGQVVDLDQPFSVGGAQLDHPGDMTGPADEVINCRCTMGYEVDDSQEAVQQENTGPIGEDEWTDWIEVSASAFTEEKTMPWHIVEDSAECSDSEPYAVVKDDDGAVEGCHSTREAAEAQLAALYASEDDAVTAATEDRTDHVMIALVPTNEDAYRLARDDGDPIEELHVTLAYFGQIGEDLEEGQLDDLRVMARNLAEDWRTEMDAKPITGRVAGRGTLGDEEPVAAVLFMNGQEMATLQSNLRQSMDSDSWREQYEPWIPHLTVGYGIDPTSIEPPDEIVFDRVRFAVGGDVTDYPLTADMIAPDDDTEPPPREASTMDWYIDHGRTDCPETTPWAIVRRSDNSVVKMFEFGWQATEGLETLQAAFSSLPVVDAVPVETNASETAPQDTGTALAANTAAFQDGEGGEDDNGGDEDCPEGHHMMPDGSCMPDEDMEISRFWEGVLAVEGIPTGDGRMFAEDSLVWPDPEEVTVALRWQKEDSHGGMQVNGVVNVGRITQIWRDGNKIMGRGEFDTHPDAVEANRRMSTKNLTGVSIDADDPEDPMGMDVEFVYPEGCESEDGVIDLMDEDAEFDMDCLFPELVVFHSGRIRAATLVDLPAFVEAQLFVVDADSLTASVQIEALGAVSSHSTATTDESWDGSANEGRLPSPMTLAKARQAYAWFDSDAVEDDEITKSACKFIHHEVDADGNVGAANLTACSSGIGILNGGRGGTDIPASDREGVYNHLARHLRDADREPPPLEASVNDTETTIASLTAQTHLMEIPGRPPAEWFQEPTDVPDIGAMTVTDEGRVYGYLAPKNVAHRGFSDRRIEVPMKNVDYGRWMNRTTIVAGGERIATGPITMECGHAGTGSWIGADGAIDHYDNSCSIVAAVRVGENSKGVWIAGALLPDVKPEQVARMMMCQLSGDWRPHREKAGMRELTAALLVPVPGFPMESPRVQLRMDRGQLVASAVPVRYAKLDDDRQRLEARKNRKTQPAETRDNAQDDMRAQAKALAADIGRDQRGKLAALAASVRERKA